MGSHGRTWKDAVPRGTVTLRRASQSLFPVRSACRRRWVHRTTQVTGPQPGRKTNHMANSNTKTSGLVLPAGSSPVSTGGSVPVSTTGNGSNSSGNAGSGGVSSSPTPIPGAGTTAKRGLRTELTQVVSGIGTQFPDGTTIAVNGVQTSKQQLLNALAALLALFANVDTAATTLKSQRAALKAASPGGRQQLASIKAGTRCALRQGKPCPGCVRVQWDQATPTDGRAEGCSEVEGGGDPDTARDQGPTCHSGREVPRYGPGPDHCVWHPGRERQRSRHQQQHRWCWYHRLFDAVSRR